MKKKIGIDIDDVLVDTFKHFLDYYNREYMANFKFDKHTSFKLWFDWIGNKEKALNIFYNFFNSHFFKDLTPSDYSIKSIKNLSEKFELFAITSRDKKMEEDTQCFFDKFFENSFQGILFTNQFSKKGQVKTKAQICKELGIPILIEDRRKYAIECANEEIKVFLLDKPWNQNCEHENITRVKNWKEVLMEIEKLK